MLKTAIWLMISSIVFLSTTGFDRPSETLAATQNVSAQDNFLQDQSLPAYQSELLDLAFNTATQIPVKPHIKDRSRSQEVVVNAALQLDQPRRALDYIAKIDNWRKGTGYGDLALYCAQKDCKNKVEEFLTLAEKVAQETEDWRKDNIKVKIAKVHAMLGEDQKAEDLEKNVVDSEAGKVAATKAMTAEKEAFDGQLKSLETLMTSENFDLMVNGMDATVQLFNRFYNDPKERDLAEKKIRASWEKMPIFVRVNLLMRMTESALSHNDQKKALKLTKEAQKLVDKSEWPAENRIVLNARLAALLHRSGDVKTARSNVEKLIPYFETEKEKILNIDYAATLRPIAETYQVMGDREAALNVYKKAVEAGVTNINSRPRAEDLSATCLSMALAKVEPDTELWQRIRQIKASLAEPW